MGTHVTLAAFTGPDAPASRVDAAMRAAVAEMRKLEGMMSSWKNDSEIARLNAQAGTPLSVSVDTYTVIDKALWAGRVSQGTFDITFQTMSDLWRFGDAARENPRPPNRRDVQARRKLLDYRQVIVDPKTRQVTVPKGRRISLGGIAKGYIVDRAADVLKKAGVVNFLVQAGGDLYGAGSKPSGPWVSGVQDPRGKPGAFFATIELTDHAFSTAGDYARSYIYEGRRYHHIIDPRTGYPATASRSVTIWAPSAFLADAIDDAVFILGPSAGLKLVESLSEVGALIVDADNKVWVSKRLKGKVRITSQPSDGI